MPVESLAEAARIARARKTTLSSVISEALSQGLLLHTAAERSEEVLNAYRKAFSGFSDQETALLDGVILKSAR